MKSRVMANAFRELIADAGEVYIMGHSFADMDAVGAAAGICCAARKRGKQARIVIDREHTAPRPDRPAGRTAGVQRCVPYPR